LVFCCFFWFRLELGIGLSWNLALGLSCTAFQIPGQANSEFEPRPIHFSYSVFISWNLENGTTLA
jgi:hypothetical protein